MTVPTFHLIQVIQTVDSNALVVRLLQHVHSVVTTLFGMWQPISSPGLPAKG